MKELTEKQKDILDYIEDFIEQESMAPTVYEIADHFGIKTSTVFAHLRSLQRKNWLTRSSKARSISLSRPKKKNRFMSLSMPIPLLGRINAGHPAEASEYRESDILVSQALLERKGASSAFALRVSGESMRDLGIYDGDVVIVKQVLPGDVKNGDIVVALVNNENTVKSYYSMSGGKIELRPANSEFQPQIYRSGEVSVQGKVIGLHREY
jgi:repressor LexA